MIRSFVLGIGGAAFALAAVVAFTSPTATQRPRRSTIGRTLTIGTISATPRQEIAVFQPFAEALARRLGRFGYASGAVAVAASIDEMVGLLRRGAVDLYIDSAFPVCATAARSGARPLLRRWKQGFGEYSSLLLARTDGDVRTLADLRGRVVAFENPHSTSHFLVAKAALMQAGLRPVVCAEGQGPPAGRAGYVFAESEENVVFWTLRGRSAAAATSSVNLARLERLHPGSLRVLWRSPPIPRHVVAVPRDLDPSLAGALERGLLTMDQDEAGRAALQAFEGTTRFDRFPRGADADLQTVRECIEILGAEAAR